RGAAEVLLVEQGHEGVVGRRGEHLPRFQLFHPQVHPGPRARPPPSTMPNAIDATTDDQCAWIDPRGRRMGRWTFCDGSTESMYRHGCIGKFSCTDVPPEPSRGA